MRSSLTDASDKLNIICASGSVVEHLLAKEGVAGSIPVSRSIVTKRAVALTISFVKATALFVTREVRSTSRTHTVTQYGFDFSEH